MTIEMKKTNRKQSGNIMKKIDKIAENSGFRNRKDDGFNCKTCGRVFSTHQALGGHSGSHRKIIKKPSESDEDAWLQLTLAVGAATVSRKLSSFKMHKCKLCDKEFEIGPSLGGHMRCHKNEKDSGKVEETESDLTAEERRPEKVEPERVEPEKVRKDLVSAAKGFRLWFG